MTTVAETTPRRTVDQRRDALGRANEVRTYRAGVKRSLKAGRLSAPLLILDPPALLASMKVVELVLAIPRVGRVKAYKMLERSRVSPSKTLGGMTQRQRVAVVERLAAR